MGGAHRLLHHVVEIPDIGEVDAVGAPQEGEAARGREVRGEGESATQSAPWLNAKERSARSFSVIAEIGSTT